jgi:hypothetical protein
MILVHESWTPKIPRTGVAVTPRAAVACGHDRRSPALHLELLMGHWLGIASNHADDHLSRAADHAVVIGVALLIALVGGLVYGVVRLVAKSRAGRTHSDRGPEGAPGPKA